MNSMQARRDEDDELERIRAVVARHRTPSFVKGFDVRLGEFDGEPAVWIIFNVPGQADIELDEHLRRSVKLAALREEVQADFQKTLGGRFPFFRFADGQVNDGRLG